MGVRQRILPAGWYPDTAAGVRREIEDFKKAAAKIDAVPAELNGGIVPHAGWYFSGRLAALVFHFVSLSSSPDVVVVFGGHLGRGPGLVYLDEAWETPLGQASIDLELTQAVANAAGLIPEGAYAGDNTVEVQLPLVKYFFPDSRLAAFRAPHTREAIELGREVVRQAQAQGKSVKVFGSTDLTHYGPNYGFSPRGSGAEAVNWVKKVNDKGFIDLALAMDVPGLLKHAAENMSACSAGAVAAAITAAQTLGSSRSAMVDYYTSFDIHRDASFVGYTGLVF